MIYYVERCLSAGFRLRLIIGCWNGLCLSIRWVWDMTGVVEIEDEYLLYSFMGFELLPLWGQTLYSHTHNDVGKVQFGMTEANVL